MRTQTNVRPDPVLITGVSSGIGLGMARKFLSEGHRVFGSVRSRERADELRRTLGESFEPLVFDICNQEQIDRAEETLSAALPEGRLSALINNAGSAEIGPLLHVAAETLERHLDTLVVGQLRVIQRFFRYLAGQGHPGGRIINISSISGVGANTYFGCYAAAKHALEGLSKTLREEVRGYGVAVTVVAPGNIATDIWTKQRPELIEPYRQTDYYAALQGKLEWIAAHAVRDAMSVEEFADALYGIFANPMPADRYTIVKERTGWGPLSRLRVNVNAH
jgi:NAD(P)-dependent dehydrogenase (short-subunit alcohol dehydrogenase family)